jgi:Undecaprenyl-phosphate glucose phosphotransferase
LGLAAVAALALSFRASPAALTLGAAAPLLAAALFGGRLLRGCRLYRFAPSEKLGPHLATILTVFALAATPAALGAAVLGAATPAVAAPVLWAGLAAPAVLGLHAWTWRRLRRRRRSGALNPNLVVVGATRHAERLIAAALERRDVNVLGVFDDRRARAPEAVAGVPVLGDTRALLDHRIMPYVDQVVLAVDPSAQARVRDLVARLRVLPNEVAVLVDLETGAERDAALARLAEAPLARVSGVAEDEDRAFAKRVQDLVIGGLATVVLAPLMAAIAVAVKLDSPGPAFFRQRRHGFNNEAITVWKFRTMRQESADATAARQVTADDERVTRLGRFLRKTSLDELPQLINVLKGEMSLVGPRPHAIGMKTGEAESSKLVAEYAWRHRMKPGMTGWAAVNGSRGPLHTAADVRRRVALDIEYVERQSFLFDLRVMLLTLPCLLGDREAVR